MMLDKPFAYIGPVSKNVVEAVLRLPTLGFIPTRNQIDWDGGYVGYTTRTFADHVSRWRPDIFIERDHGGMEDGNLESYRESLMEDSDCFSIYHIDPWKNKEVETLRDGINSTIDTIKTFHAMNPEMYFEIGTEQAVRYFPVEAYEEFLKSLYHELTSAEFSKIAYVVVQSGVALDLGNMKNLAQNTSKADYVKQINLIHSYGLLTKEHNGDYLSFAEVSKRKALGLDGINFAPEYGQFESEVIYKAMSTDQQKEFVKICLQYKDRWSKWILEDNMTPLQTVLMGGHYVFNEVPFIDLKSDMKNIDSQISSYLLKKLSNLCGLAK